MIDLSQLEADTLLALPKRRKETAIYRLPPHRGKLAVPLEDFAAREMFMLDISRGGISLERRTYQTRARQTAILARSSSAPCGRAARRGSGRRGRRSRGRKMK